MGSPQTTQGHAPLPMLMLGALGVVFGDIGTSPLYTLRECLSTIGLALTPDVVMGVLSMIFWALILVVTVEYVAFVLRADNRGEGGIFALTALAFSHLDHPRWNPVILTLGLMGGALFYGDALITPAISVLSAVEGLGVATPVFAPYVIPISVAIIVTLFSFQRFGTEKVGTFFGPIMIVWFGVLGGLGVMEIMQNPTILHALNPMYAIALAQTHPLHVLLVLGSVVLAITGAEALYADMGHFGRAPIRATWLLLVLPSLVLNYFGQGALVLRDPNTLGNPFFLMMPEDYRLAFVLLATAATVIASQAVISGAFSLTNQAIQLGYLPRIGVLHTSNREVGQVYLPSLNALMMVAVVFLVLTFRNSSNLAAAYGIAVTGTIVITTLLASTVLVRRLGWSPAAAGVFLLAFLSVNGVFFLSNLPKIPHGGWFPLLFGVLMFSVMHTWVRGRQVASEHHARFSPSLDEFLEHLPKATRVPRTAIYLTSSLNYAPPALMYNLAHNQVLHQQVILIKVARARIPRYPEGERIRVTFLPHGFSAITTTYGFMEQPDIPGILARCAEDYGLMLEFPQATSYFLSHHTYIPSSVKRGLNRWQEPVFVFLESVTQSAISYFRIPNTQVVEIGAQVEI